MHATSRMLRPNLLAAATRARAPASARRSGLGARHIPGRPVQAFRCNAASLTSEDDATLEAEAERPTRIAQQVRRERLFFASSRFRAAFERARGGRRNESRRRRPRTLFLSFILR
jgi:hypothetical protein